MASRVDNINAVLLFMEKKSMEIVNIKINKLKPYENNAKLHPQEQIEQIKNSIMEFGFNDPVAVYGADNIIVEGHGRVLSAKELGMDEVPCIRLDHLTDEERKAYTLVHNKLTMNSGFDIDVLNKELSEIMNVDMTDLGFDLNIDLFDNDLTSEIDKELNAETTQERVENILNLGYAQFKGTGKYDIPMLEPVYELPKIDEWIGFNYVLSDSNPHGKGVHFFIDDYQFERVWTNPSRYVEKLKEYACVIAPDFSPYGDMPLATQIFNHYRKHWVARYLQEHGVIVIPCIRSSTDERSLEWFLDGTPSNSIIAVSSMWASRDEFMMKANMDEWEYMIEKLSPSKVMVYGKTYDYMKGAEIEKIESFTEKRWGN